MILRTILYFALSLAIFAAGYLTTHDRKNLLTVVAVLGLLPASKSLVNMIMFLKAKGCSQNAFAAISPFDQHLFPQYDLYITSYQKNFAISHMIVEDKVILGYTESVKCDCRACEEHLLTMLKQSGFKDMTIKISDKLETYCEQLRKMNEKEQDNHPEKDDAVRVVLYDISL